jgi:TonB family protein
MAYYSTSGRDPSQPVFPAEVLTPLEDPILQSPPETDCATLAARLAGSGGAGLSLELSSSLVLEIVLHEIAEHACLATGATGAAIVLERDNEMVCRASSGPTAPQLGSRMDAASGLSGECLRTQQVLRCEDTEIDPRADVEACRRLAVRSVTVLPILRAAGDRTTTIGIFELFSSRPSAFSDRDQYTLEVLALRVLKTLEGSIAPPIDWAAVTQAGENPVASPEFGSAPKSKSHGDPQTAPADAIAAPASDLRMLDVVTGALAAILLVCTVGLGVRAAQHLETRSSRVRAHETRGPEVTPRQLTDRVRGIAARATSSSSVLPSPPSATRTPPAVRTTQPHIPDGDLRVYDNGKEVFRLPPSSDKGAASDNSGMQLASSRHPESAVSLSPAATLIELVDRVEPDYPEVALERQIQGAVVLEAHIRTDGTIQALKLISGQALLADAAMTAVKRWRFKSHLANGSPAQMQTTITLNFRLPR